MSRKYSLKKKELVYTNSYEPALVYFFMPFLNKYRDGIRYNKTNKGVKQYNLLLLLPTKYSKG